MNYTKFERALSPCTIECYLSDLRRWLLFLAEGELPMTVEAVTPQVICKYLAGLGRHGMKPATILRRANCLGSFWRFLIESGYAPDTPFRLIHLPGRERNLPAFLVEEVFGVNYFFGVTTTITSGSALGGSASVSDR